MTTGLVSRRSPGGGELREAGRRLRAAPVLGFPYAFGFMDRLFRDTFSLDALSVSASVGPESVTRPDETRNPG